MHDKKDDAVEAVGLPTGPIITLEHPFIDDRGNIQPLVEGRFSSSQIITSIAGSVRANHYHKTDWHYMYFITGLAKYYYRPTGSDEPPEWCLVRAGQMVFTPPMYDHAVEYIEDTTFMNFARNPRNQENYESDLVRVELIKQKDG
jgi:dTDP-4-dehydrorhamnose 3,5-epimerase-like enzyme